MKYKLLILLGVLFSVSPLYVHAQGVESADDEDNPGARAYYDWLRLHDPATGKIPDDIREKELRFAGTLPAKEDLANAKLQKTGRIEQAQTTTWLSRGPYNVGGRSRAIAADIADPNVLLAGGVSGGMWRSANGGVSWTHTTSPNQLHSVTRIVQDTRPGKTNIWYQGTGELDGQSQAGNGTNASFRGDGIFKSTDDGISWTQLLSTVSGTPQVFDATAFKYVWNVVTDPSNLAQDVVYAALVDRIAQSTDGGTTWTTVLGASSLGTGYSRYTDVAISPTGVLYAVLSAYNNVSGSNNSPDQGVYRSTDGVNWTNITPATWPANYNRFVIGLAPSNENAVYFLGETPGSGFHTTYAGTSEDNSLWKYNYLSGDGSGAGGSWVNRSANLPAFGGNVGDFASQGGYDLVVSAKPDNENIVFVGGTNLYRSTDGFATNTNTSWIGGYATSNDVSLYPNQHPDQHVLFFNPNSPGEMFSGNDGGLYKTTDNLASTVVWSSLNHGYTNGQFYAVAIDHGTIGNDVVIGGLQDNGSWFTNNANPSTPWVSILGGDGAYSAIADGRTSYYVSSQGGNTYRLVLNTNGSTSAFTKVTPTGGSGYLFVNPFVLDPNNTNMMYLAGGTTPWRNSDLTGIPLSSNSTTSVNWTKLTNSSVGTSTISALGVSKTPPNRLYFGTADGKVYRLDGANSGNPAPTDVWTGKGFPSGAYVECVAVDPSNYNNAMVVFSNYNIKSLFYTTNGGTNWTAVSGNLEQNPDGTGNGPSTRWVKIMPSGLSTIYLVGTSTGIYSTTSLNGASTVWGQEGASTIGNVVVDMIDARETDGYVVAGTHGNSIFSTNIVSSFTVKVRKYRDADGDPLTTGDMTPRKWHLELYQNNLSNLIAQADTSELNVTGLAAGTYIAAEADSGAKWIRVNGNGTRYDTLLIGTAATQIDTFTNLKKNSLTVRKYQDFDGNFSTVSGRVGVNWHLEIHKNSPAGPIVTSGDGLAVTADGLGDGTYYAVEGDSAGWNHIGYIVNGYPAASANNYAQVIIANGVNDTVDFVNSNNEMIYNSITVRKFIDQDKNLSTDADRSPKKWHLEVRVGVPNGPLVSSDDSTSTTATMLPDATYYAVEADSAGWIHLGNSVDGGAPVSSGSNYRALALSGGQNVVVDFFNAPPIYSQVFRTAKAEDWATSADGKGKLKAVKRKADKVVFKRNIGVPADVNGFTLKLNMNSTGKVYTTKIKADTLVPDSPWDSVKQVSYTAALSGGDSLQVEGRGYSGKLFDFTVLWATSPRPIMVHYKKDTPGWKLNRMGLPMPDLQNVGDELFPKGFGQPRVTYFTTSSPLFIGKQKGGNNPNSVRLQKYSDVQKTLIKRTRLGDSLHVKQPRCLAFFDTEGQEDFSKPISKQQTSLPPDKHNNKLLAEVLALKLNVAASIANKFPGDLGELTFADESQPGNPMNGKTVDSILIIADRVLACVSSSPHTPQEVYAVVRAIDSVFAGPIDTNGFASKTSLKGTKMLSEVGILHATQGMAPRTFFSPPVTDDLPLVYSLRQNYPNPYNPTTRIQFELPEPAVVTLNVYNILGQKVATIFDQESMEDGVQEVEFDAANLASGVYFYRLEAHGVPDEDGNGGQIYMSVKKMMVVK